VTIESVRRIEAGGTRAFVLTSWVMLSVALDFPLCKLAAEACVAGCSGAGQWSVVGTHAFGLIPAGILAFFAVLITFVGFDEGLRHSRSFVTAGQSFLASLGSSGATALMIVGMTFSPFFSSAAAIVGVLFVLPLAAPLLAWALAVTVSWRDERDLTN